MLSPLFSLFAFLCSLRNFFIDFSESKRFACLFLEIREVTFYGCWSFPIFFSEIHGAKIKDAKAQI